MRSRSASMQSATNGTRQRPVRRGRFESWSITFVKCSTTSARRSALSGPLNTSGQALAKQCRLRSTRQGHLKVRQNTRCSARSPRSDWSPLRLPTCSFIHGTSHAPSAPTRRCRQRPSPPCTRASSSCQRRLCEHQSAFGDAHRHPCRRQPAGRDDCLHRPPALAKNQ